MGACVVILSFLPAPQAGRSCVAQGEVEDEPWEWKTPFNASPIGAVVTPGLFHAPILR